MSCLGSHCRELRVADVSLANTRPGGAIHRGLVFLPPVLPPGQARSTSRRLHPDPSLDMSGTEVWYLALDGAWGSTDIGRMDLLDSFVATARSRPALLPLSPPHRPMREWAYDRESAIGKLDKGLDEAKTKGWTVVHMEALEGRLPVREE